MATQRECEGWIGDTKQENCKRTGRTATMTYGRKETPREIQYGWSCSSCDTFLVTQRFSK